MNLSENLKKIRKEHNLSQEQLAEKLGVSRQSVSKWESNQAYPEMDKLLQICQIFKLNIDELLNQDVKEINNTRQAKNNVNKFIESFLDYITKTIDMFSHMKFKNKIKCILEQIIIIIFLVMVFEIAGMFLKNIITGLIYSLPSNVYYTVINILESIYLIICLILGIVLILHIFKVRYLDYYIIVNNDNIDSKKGIKEIHSEPKNETIETQGKQTLKETKEKIIIRDPKHSEYKFISILLKFLLFIIKTVISCIAIFFCFSLVVFVLLTVITFLFLKTGILFIGGFITLVSFIIINTIILIIMYNFIISKKNNLNILSINFIISLITTGIGIGLIFIGLSDFKLISNLNDKHYIKEEYRISMNNNIILDDWNVNIEYVESDDKDIRIVYTHSNYLDISLEKGYYDDNYFYFNTYVNFDDELSIIKNLIKDINDKKIINYSLYKITIYSSKENIQKIKDNKLNYYKAEDDINLQNIINEYEKRISALEEEIVIRDSKIYELEEQIENEY